MILLFHSSFPKRAIELSSSPSPGSSSRRCRGRRRGRRPIRCRRPFLTAPPRHQHLLASRINSSTRKRKAVKSSSARSSSCRSACSQACLWWFSCLLRVDLLFVG
uniref:Uncharacterized protein n=1 Tax=Leersia perrieri TaxID=77586 RepID=A0A0D9V4K9_9ORYZ